MHFYILWVAVWWVMFSLDALGEPSYTYEDLYHKALHHPQLGALDYQRQAYGYKAIQHQYPSDPLVGVVSMGPQSQYVTLSQKLTPKYSLTFKAYTHKQNQTEAMIRATKRDIRHQLIVLYATIFALERKLNIMIEYQRFLSSLFQAHTKGFAAQGGGQQAWIMARKEQIRVRLERLELDRHMNQAQHSLGALVGDLSTHLTFHHYQLPEPQISHTQLTQLTHEFHSNKTINLVALEPHVHELNFLKTQSQLGRWHRNIGLQVQAQQRLRGGDHTPPWILSVQVSFPLWGKQKSSRYLALQQDSLAQHNLIEAKNQELIAEILSLSFAAESYEKSLSEYRLSLIPLFKHQLTTTQSGYAAQKNTLGELIASQKSLYDAQHQYYTNFVHLTHSLSQIQMLTNKEVGRFFERK